MFNPANEASLWLQAVVRSLRKPAEDIDSYCSAIGGLICSNLDQQQEMVDLACRLALAKSDLSQAKTRAHQNACAALLALGLFAVQAYGFALYFLPN